MPTSRAICLAAFAVRCALAVPQCGHGMNGCRDHEDASFLSFRHADPNFSHPESGAPQVDPNLTEQDDVQLRTELISAQAIIDEIRGQMHNLSKALAAAGPNEEELTAEAQSILNMVGMYTKKMQMIVLHMQEMAEKYEAGLVNADVFQLAEDKYQLELNEAAHQLQTFITSETKNNNESEQTKKMGLVQSQWGWSEIVGDVVKFTDEATSKMASLTKHVLESSAKRAIKTGCRNAMRIASNTAGKPFCRWVGGQLTLQCEAWGGGPENPAADLCAIAMNLAITNRCFKEVSERAKWGALKCEQAGNYMFQDAWNKFTGHHQAGDRGEFKQKCKYRVYGECVGDDMHHENNVYWADLSASGSQDCENKAHERAKKCQAKVTFRYGDEQGTIHHPALKQYTIHPASNSQEMCFNVFDARFQSKTHIQLYSPCTKAQNELWVFEDDKTIRLASHRGLCFNAAWGVTKSNNYLQIYWCTAAPNEKFVYSQHDQTIRSATNSNYCVHTAGGTLNKHEGLKLGRCTGAANQRFSLLQASK